MGISVTMEMDGNLRLLNHNCIFNRLKMEGGKVWKNVSNAYKCWLDNLT
jgi:hypothetical protein